MEDGRNTDRWAHQELGVGAEVREVEAGDVAREGAEGNNVSIRVRLRQNEVVRAGETSIVIVCWDTSRELLLEALRSGACLGLAPVEDSQLKERKGGWGERRSAR